MAHVPSSPTRFFIRVDIEIRVEIETREEHHVLFRVLLLRSIRRPQRPPYSHSLLRSIRQALLKSGERTFVTAGSHDFTDDNFFPNLVNLFLNDMGNNLNANGAAPVAPYVFLSFLFEMVVEFMFLLCILLLC